MPTTHSQPTRGSRPAVGISSCLMGQAVRYDGGDKRQPLLLRCLQAHVDWQPFCPEVKANLGVPRPPIRLLQDQSGSIKAMGVADDALDVTDTLISTSQRQAEELAALPHLCGYVVKARSPSCGLATTPSHDASGQVLALTDGLFTAALKRRLPGLALVDEDGLANREACWRFLSACYLIFFRRFRHLPYPGLIELLPQPRNDNEMVEWVTALLASPEQSATDKAVNKKAVPQQLLEQLFEFWRTMTPETDAL